MEIHITAVNNRNKLRKFVKFPFRLYAENQCWVPPLISDEMKTLDWNLNPAFDACISKYWLAYQGNKIVGRIAGIINENEIVQEKKKIARFGWFDFINSQSVSDKLLSVFENWAKENGIQSVHGPLGFSDMDPQGFLIEGFNELGTMATIYNHPYYAAHLEKNNYEKSVDWVEYELKIPKNVPQRLLRAADVVKRRFSIKSVKIQSAKDVLPYSDAIFRLINKTYEDLYGFVPLSDRQIKVYTKQYFSFIKPGFISILLDKNSQLVAVGITMPSLSNALQKAKGRLWPIGFLHLLRAMNKNDTADLYLIGIDPSYQGKGLHAIIFSEIIEHFGKIGITTCETNIELEDNINVQKLWKVLDRRLHKRRRCYQKKLL